MFNCHQFPKQFYEFIEGFLNKNMGVFDFKKRFGQPINIEEIKKDFINKINHFLFKGIDKHIGSKYYRSNELFNYLCLSLNKEPEEVLKEYNRDPYSDPNYIPPLKYLTRNDYRTTLIVIEVLHQYFINSNEYAKEQWIEKIDKVVKFAINQPVSLKISWRDGKFYPEEAKELSEKLIQEPLEWLENYPKVSSIFKNALDHYSKSLQDFIKRKDVISNSFQAVEELVRSFLKNDKSFDNNFGEFIEKLKLNNHWKQILNRYKELSKEFGRHPGREEFIPEQSDTEAFLYLSGLILRLILEKLKDQK